MLEKSGEILHHASSTKTAQIKHLDRFRMQHQEKKQLKTQALTDPLMAIWNRRALLGNGDTGEIEGVHFVPHLTREIAEARGGGKRTKPSMPLSVLMLDIDHFKDLNDKFGHTAGDLTLRSLAKLLSDRTRAADIVGRYGGEELLIILPKTNQMNAIQEAERLRKLVESNEIEFEGKKIKVSISIGVVELNDSHEKPLDLVRDADTNLYQAKNDGRNRVFPQPSTDSILQT
jgi:diguanylate cyclase (GGDEF)-like protein